MVQNRVKSVLRDVSEEDSRGRTDKQPAARISRDPRRLRFGALVTMLVLGLVCCALIAAPFLSALTWAFALAVVASPFHRRVERRLGRPNVAAGVSVLAVTIVLLIPAAVVAWLVGVQASEGLDRIEAYLNERTVRDLVTRLPGGARLYETVFSDGNGGSTLVPRVQEQAGVWIVSAGAGLVQVLVALFALFFLLRDGPAAREAFRAYMPMSRSEADYFLERIRSMTHATLFGNVVTATIQGTLGGLMFFVLGLPGAVLWGAVMALLSLVPSAGAFVIWIPAAAILAAQDEWGRAIVLAGWGALVVGTIDNVLFPWLVGKEMRLHTLIVFFAVVGGLIAFGPAGLVLGPVTAAATIAMLDIMQRRLSNRRIHAELH